MYARLNAPLHKAMELCLGIALAALLATSAESSPVLYTEISHSVAQSGFRVGQAAPNTLLAELPLYFVENRGQTDTRVAYYVQGRGKTLFFTAQGVTFAQRDAEGERYALQLDFVNANPGVRPQGIDRTEAVISYFRGSPDQWKTGLPTFAGVAYRALWPGIDLIYHGTATQLKHEFVVRPGADPGLIRLAYRGAMSVQIDEAGQLQVSTPVGSFTDARPYAYQQVAGRTVEVTAGYALTFDRAGVYEYSFTLGAYDPSLPLVIDPVVLLYAGYIGGSATDTVEDMATDSAGNAYVVGVTTSDEGTFPVAVGPDLSYNCCVSGSAYDAFVAKVKADGTGLIYAGYIGGWGSDSAAGVAVDDAGNAYVVGQTDSSETEQFPVAVGPDLVLDGEDDGFVAKVKADGTGLEYAGYLSGYIQDVAVDEDGNAYLVGLISSEDTAFPALVGPDLSANGADDAFVAKVKADGSGLDYAGYIGGSNCELALGIAVDSAGRANVVGGTESSEAQGFPVLHGPDLSYGGAADAFVAGVKANGSGLRYAGYIGGSDWDDAHGIAVGRQGSVYVVGSTNSTRGEGFPALFGPDVTYNGGRDAFVAKFQAGGIGFDYAGYIGGSSDDTGVAVGVDATGNAYVAGTTDSTETQNFPVLVGPDATHNGEVDAFVAKIYATDYRVYAPLIRQ